MMPKRKSIATSRKARTLRRWLLSIVAALILLLVSWLSDALTTVRFPDSLTPTLLYSTEMHDDLGLTMGRAIEEAENSITLIIYTLTEPSIIKRLRDKSLAGCNVKVICDAKNAKDLELALGPKVAIIKRYTPALMHQKILVIDEKQTWIGSANMTAASLRHHGNLLLAIESEGLAARALAKADSFTPGERLSSFPHQSFVVGGQQLELCFLPDDSQAILRIKRLIQTASKTLRVAMFTWTRQDLAKAMIDAKKRGVDVQIILDSSSSLGASAEIFQQLKKSGVSVKVTQSRSLLHHKFMVIDGKTLVNGSANWTKQAFSKNDDCFVILHDLNESQRNFLENTWQIMDSEAAIR